MTNGIVLLNLEDRNAANFDRILVPGSYDKAAGAAEAGAYVNVYKWQYQGFMMAASVCTAEDKGSYILLTDKMRAGVMFVFPDDTIYLEGSSYTGLVEPLNVIANGVYVPESGVSGFNPVTVNVPSSAGAVYNGIRFNLRTNGAGATLWPEINAYMAKVQNNQLRSSTFYMTIDGQLVGAGSFTNNFFVRPLDISINAVLSLHRTSDGPAYMRLYAGSDGVSAGWYYGTLNGQQISNPTQLSEVEIEIPGSTSDPSINIVLWKEI